ncbi:MAG: hypothetical protein COB22_05380 [Cycloclasticus sp.]|nr:MAG: hypothetical protein COB22_05380 [Cycloclasticus sp.]
MKYQKTGILAKKPQMNNASYLTLKDVKELLEMSAIEKLTSISDKVSIATEVGVVNDSDGDFKAAILILGGRVIIYSDRRAQCDLYSGKKVTYHLQAWSQAGQEYRHLAKTDNFRKLIELGLALSIGDKQVLNMYVGEVKALTDDF